MDRMAGGILVLVLGLSVLAAKDHGQDQPTTPAEQYKTLLKECHVAPEVLSKPPTDEERKKAAARMHQLPLRFLELAEKNAKDPIAVDALIQVVWMVNNTAFPAGGKDNPGSRAMALVLRDHVRSDKLGPICLRLVQGFHKEHELFLRTVLEMSPHRDVRGLACLSLAQFLDNRLQRLHLVKDQPDLAKRYEGLFGKELWGELQRQDRAKAAQEAEALYEQAAGKYGDVRIPSGGDWQFHPGAASVLGERPLAFGSTVGEKVKAVLFDIHHLAIGKEAPDIEGEDQDGKHFMLSDYRGEVVLLDFWSQF